jgi:hypothetical protein
MSTLTSIQELTAMRKKSSLLNSIISLGVVSYSILRRGFSKLGNSLQVGRAGGTLRLLEWATGDRCDWLKVTMMSRREQRTRAV